MPPPYGGRKTRTVLLTKHFASSDNSESFLGLEHTAAIEIIIEEIETFWLTWKEVEGQPHPLAAMPKGAGRTALPQD